MRFSYDLLLREVDLQKIFYPYTDTMKFKTEIVILKEIKSYNALNIDKVHIKCHSLIEPNIASDTILHHLLVNCSFNSFHYNLYTTVPCLHFNRIKYYVDDYLCQRRSIIFNI